MSVPYLDELSEAELANLAWGARKRQITGEKNRAAVLKAMQSGLDTVADIEAVTKLSRSAVANHMEALGRPPTKKRMKRHFAQAMLREGASVAQVAQATGLAKPSVRYYLWEIRKSLDMGKVKPAKPLPSYHCPYCKQTADINHRCDPLLL